MANRRMFSLKIVDTDLFLDMSKDARLLYYDLAMRADDDGFISNPRRIMRAIGASEDDLKLLFLKKFVIPFENGICVIKHWRVHNYIQKDRYEPTQYAVEKSQLIIDEKGIYFDRKTFFEENRLKTPIDVNNIDTECIQNVSSG